MYSGKTLHVSVAERLKEAGPVTSPRKVSSSRSSFYQKHKKGFSLNEKSRNTR